MFLQAAHSGRKEAECMICWGHQHGLLHLDPQADISAVQAVGPSTSREEIRDLYYQVYKLWRLPGSPLCGQEWTEELISDVVSSLKDCLRQKGGQPSRGLGESKPADAQPPQSKTQRRRRDTSAKRDLTEVREAHWRALAAAAALEERIERLSCSITRNWQDACAHSLSCDHWRRRSQGQSRMCHSALLEDSPIHSPAHSPPWWGPGTQKTRRLNHLSWNLT